MYYIKQKHLSALSSNRIKNKNFVQKIKNLSLPNISSNSPIKDYVTKARNPFYFSFRLSEPKKIKEKFQKITDYTALLSKTQRIKLLKLKETVRKIEKEKLRKYVETNKNIIKYKNMLPIPIWNKCEKEYEEYKKKYKKLIISKKDKKQNKSIKINIDEEKNEEIEKYLKKNLSVSNINPKNKNYLNNKLYIDKSNNFEKYNSTKNIRNKFENQGLNKFIENIENQLYINSHNLILNNPIFNKKFKKNF